MSQFQKSDNTTENVKKQYRSNGLMVGLLLGIVLYFLIVASNDSDFLRYHSHSDESAIENNSKLSSSYNAEELCRVDRVVDGDTIVVISDGIPIRVRLIGVDTPETVKFKTSPQPYGAEAANYTRRRITTFNNLVLLRSDGDQVDRYGRRLALVYLGKNGAELLNEELLRLGLAKAELQYNYSDTMKRRFQKAEDEAKAEKLGIWSQSNIINKGIK